MDDTDDQGLVPSPGDPDDVGPGGVDVDVDPEPDLVRDPDPPARPADGGADAAGRARRSPWGAVAGVVVFVYVVVFAAALGQIADRNRFNRWGAAMGSLGARLVICVVVLATLFHTFDGLRRLVAEVAPGSVAHDVRIRAAVLFLTWAVAIPCFAAIVWPWIAETTR